MRAPPTIATRIGLSFPGPRAYAKLGCSLQESTPFASGPRARLSRHVLCRRDGTYNRSREARMLQRSLLVLSVAAASPLAYADVILDWNRFALPIVNGAPSAPAPVHSAPWRSLMSPCSRQSIP